MTALLPSRKQDEVRAFVGAKPAPAPSVHPLEAECAQLRAELGEARIALADLERERAREVEEALEAGRREGLAQAESRETDRLIELEAALGGAATLFDRKLAGLDRLAAELAGVALTRLFDDAAESMQLCGAFIARQVERLRAAGIVRAHVSAADFADEAGLEALAGRVRATGAKIEIVRDAALPAGRARLDLALGQADLDLAGQLHALAMLLRDMARE